MSRTSNALHEVPMRFEYYRMRLTLACSLSLAVMGSEKNKYAIAFGEVLKQWRRKAKLSQDALAEKADLERTFISFLERGERQPSLSTIIALASALGIQPEEVVRLTMERLR